MGSHPSRNPVIPALRQWKKNLRPFCQTDCNQRKILNTLKKLILSRGAKIAAAIGVRKVRLGQKSMRDRHRMEN
jgi:hypothetical protein